MISPLTSGLMVTWTTGWILPLAMTMLVRLWRATSSVWTGDDRLAFFEDGHQCQREQRQADGRKNDAFPAFFGFCHDIMY